MSGGISAGNARVRIKGRKGSVVRFLIISIAYTLPWIIMLSQLAYYSKVYGPQVLLQLNIAYYLPSIPVLLLFGQIEKLLDSKCGRTASMALRLMAGLAACAALAAYYPFMPTRLAYLLGLVVALGAVSSVAFSTSYQLVAWFRSADTIALGIGCVASGPLALVIQIGLQIGTKPTHWQWIALFEIAAAVVVVGIAATLSLLWQYWGILSGTEPYDDGCRQPLLDDEQHHVEEAAGQQALLLSRILTLQDPFQGFPFTTTPGMLMPHPSGALRRAASDDITDRRRHARSDRAAAAAEVGAAGLKPSAACTAAAVAAAAAAAGRKHTHTNTLGRASAPLHPSNHALYNGDLAATPATAACVSEVSDGMASAAAGSTQGGGVSTTGIHLGGPAPTAAAVAASVRAVSLQHYSGLPMVAPPGSSTAGGAWLPDIEQQLAGGGTSSVCTQDTPLDTPKDLFWLGSSVPSVSPRSSRGGSPGPYNQPALAAAAAAAAAQQGGQGFPGPAFPLAACAEEPQHIPQQREQQQQPMLASVLGGSAPVMPLAASLAPDPWDDPSLRHNLDTQADALSQQGNCRPLVSPARLQQALQWHVDLDAHAHQQQQQTLAHLDGEDRRQSMATGMSPRAAAAKKFGHRRTDSTASAAVTSVVTGGGGSVLGDEEQGEAAPESLVGVFAEVLRGTWMVVLAALISSTLLNCIFPFFTYVESSGLLGEFLPQVLFYTRMLSDILGRLLPRRKALAITAPAALLALSGTLLVASAGFFVYLQVPPRMQHDPFVMVLILLLWLGGGYINTMSYILAPSLVDPRVCTKASAVMALTYQIAHILGLVIATALALALYGDIAGEL